MSPGKQCLIVLHLLLFGVVVSWLPTRNPPPWGISPSALSAIAARQAYEFTRTNRVEAKWLKELVVLRKTILENAREDLITSEDLQGTPQEVVGKIAQKVKASNIHSRD